MGGGDRKLAGEPLKRPTREQIAAARGGKVPDLLVPGLRVLFVGINPSLYSAAVGHHFARPGNRFWPTLHAAGFTPRVLLPDEDAELPRHGVGVTNIAFRPTRAADQLSREELRAGAAELERTVRRHRPRLVAVGGPAPPPLGVGPAR